MYPADSSGCNVCTEHCSVCVAFCRFALQDCWLLNQETLSLPPALFSSTLVQPHHLSTQWLSSFFCPGLPVQLSPWFNWVLSRAVQRYTITLPCVSSCLLLSLCFCACVLYIVVIKAGGTAIGLFKFISPLFYCLILMDLNEGM